MTLSDWQGTVQQNFKFKAYWIHNNYVRKCLQLTQRWKMVTLDCILNKEIGHAMDSFLQEPGRATVVLYITNCQSLSFREPGIVQVSDMTSIFAKFRNSEQKPWCPSDPATRKWDNLAWFIPQYPSDGGCLHANCVCVPYLMAKQTWLPAVDVLQTL